MKQRLHGSHNRNKSTKIIQLEKVDFFDRKWKQASSRLEIELFLIKIEGHKWNKGLTGHITEISPLK